MKTHEEYHMKRISAWAEVLNPEYRSTEQIRYEGEYRQTSEHCRVSVRICKGESPYLGESGKTTTMVICTDGSDGARFNRSWEMQWISANCMYYDHEPDDKLISRVESATGLNINDLRLEADHVVYQLALDDMIAQCS